MDTGRFIHLDIVLNSSLSCFPHQALPYMALVNCHVVPILDPTKCQHGPLNGAMRTHKDGSGGVWTSISVLAPASGVVSTLHRAHIPVVNNAERGNTITNQRQAQRFRYLRYAENA